VAVGIDVLVAVASVAVGNGVSLGVTV